MMSTAGLSSVIFADIGAEADPSSTPPAAVVAIVFLCVAGDAVAGRLRAALLLLRLA